MKRRISIAVLPLIATVLLAGSQAGTAAPSGASGGKGQPWAGERGITVSVGKLAAQQRAQDRRRGGKPLVIREKPEPVESEGDEEAQEEEGERGKEGESGEEGGGEEEHAPKLRGASLPQNGLRPSGPAAGEPLSALATGTSFLGAQVSEAGFIPPDSMGAVGPSQVLVIVNGRIKVFDKQGNLGGLNVTDSVFWNSVRNGQDVTDPEVEYDRLSGRWILSQINLANNNNRVMVAVSSGPTITDSSSFTFFQFNHGDPPPAGGSSLFADYPQMGIDKNAVYIGVNNFGGGFDSTSAFVIRKSSILGAGPIVVTAFRGLAVGGGPGLYTPQPAQSMDPAVNEGYLVGVDNQLFSQLDIRRITDPGGTPAISGNLTVTVPATVAPQNVPAQGTHNSLDALDDRLYESMVARKPDGTLSLWTAHNIEVNASGVASTTGNRDGARWYELGNLTTSPSLIQSGTLFDPAASNPRYFWIPSIAANGQGHASLNTSTAGSGRFAEIASSGHLTSDSVGSTQAFDITQASSSPYNLGQGSTKRWGDYSQTVVDPNDNQTFWTIQEYANATDSWAVRVIQLKAPPPAMPSAASPPTINSSDPSETVVITGTSSGGSGFFDPGADSGGPGFPDHISASVSGGVTVNSITYSDPTHVTLDLDTTGASDGLKDVTITNPDGQSSTGSNVITVGVDTTPPAPPTVSSTSPTSPANNNSPKIVGSAEAGSTVKLYTDAACTEPFTASGTAAVFASPGITVSVGNDSTTTFFAKATDAASNTSGCSSSSATYVEDSTAPAAPSGLAVSPVGPANDNNPKVSGSAESGSTVKVYKAPTASDCTPGNLAVTGTDAAFASPGLTAPVSDNTTTTFRATATDAAGNVSSCSSSSVNYTEDSAPPAAPTGLAVSPASPANQNSPQISGSAEAGSTVKVYKAATASDCTPGNLAVTGTDTAFGSPGLSVSVADNTTTIFRATATDAVGNVSACSSSSVTYTEDSAAPAAPTFSGTTPASPANDNSPEVTGSAEAGSTVKLYTDSGCTEPFTASNTAAVFASPGITVSVGNDSTTTFFARATDAAGNASGCSPTSITYVEDSAFPASPTFTSTNPSSPANNNSPKILGSVEGGSTVKLYKAPTASDCTPGNLAVTGTDAAFASPGLTVSVADNTTTTFRATATDAAGNASGCSPTSITYVEDSSAPASPTFTSTDPTSPANNNSPKVIGNAEGGSTVKLYTDGACTEPFTAIGPAATFASPGITVSVGDNSSTTFFARATDAANNTSGCSSSSITYMEDSAAPASPTFTSTSPTSPANSNSPKILGSAEGGSTVKLYTDAGCTEPFTASNTAAVFASPGITVSVGDDSITTFFAKASDAAGNTSACSPTSITYVEDSSAPGLPTFTSTNPSSPADDNSPRITGSAEAGSTVKLYTDAACTEPFTASNTAAVFASPGITVSVGDNTTTTFYATATDPVGNASGCSTSSITYEEDSAGPAAPVITDTDPDSPSQTSTTPMVKGSASADTVNVEVFTQGGCAGPAVTGSKAVFEGAGIGVSVSPNQTTTLSALARDASNIASSCSPNFSYTHDNLPPAPPTVSSTSPGSPANNNSPKILGSAEGGSTVKLYTDSGCTEPFTQMGNAAAFASPGIPVSVGEDSTTTFFAKATDAAGNASACSSTSVTYIEDSSTPASPTFTSTNPSSPANNNSPKILGSAEAGSTVKLYTDAACTEPFTAMGPAATFASPGITVSVGDNSSTTFFARATDAANNTSGCSSSSITYLEDSAAPASPTFTSTSPTSPANNNSPKILGSAEGGSTVKLYTDAACTEPFTAMGSAGAFASPGITVSVGDNSSTTFFSRATDAANNTSGCSSSSITYVEDSSAPASPTFTSTNPSSPANNNSPKVIGNAEGGSTVKLYTDAACTEPFTAMGPAATFASPGITVSVGNDSTTTFFARATDAAGNTSPCSPTSITYIEDSSTPASPTFTSTNPSSPADDNTPRIRGSAESGSTVKLYTDSGCTEPFTASNTAAVFAAPGITVSVGDNTTTTFYATATDAAGNTSACSASSIIYEEDSAGPAAPLIIDTDPDSPSSTSTTPMVKGSASSDTVNVEVFAQAGCGGSASPGAKAIFEGAGIQVTVGANQTTTLSARALDAANVASSCSAGFPYTHDSLAPETTIDTGPSGITNDHSPAFSFHASETATFQCSIDTGVPTFGPCSGPGSTHTPPVPLADGTYTFRVRSTDPAGNTDPTPATRTFTVQTPTVIDAIAPETSISKGPKKKTRSRKPRISLVSSELGSLFQCRLDKAQFAPCTSPFKPKRPLRFGKHKFQAEAIDAAGNVDPTPVVRKFRVIP